MFAIINPLGKLPIESELTGDKPHQIRKRIALLLHEQVWDDL